ncbi:hypothetical protein GCM10008957_34770 [Deinococcus ruber]|uniref:histidine kinase n=1 Tax=Deinococcus ruber TaxID=1848197 RepID=A0A918F8L6_9DEIO|nr:hypothetical protein GCM10008957_34770 [Deinococcus ruber]
MQALAAARTQAEMLDATLRPAIEALGALAGAVLLIDEDAQSLRMAGHVGYDPGTLTIWQDGPIDDAVPAADVLRTRQARYFEHAGALNAAYPELEARTGAVPAVASAVLPLFLDGRPLGSLVLDFREPHVFTPDERAFLRTLAAHCILALDRTGALQRVTQQLEARDRTRAEESRAHDAFIAFTEAVGSELDLPALVRQAIVVLQHRFPEASVGYYEEDRQRSVWTARIWSDDVDPVTAAVISAGLPADLPMFAQLLQHRQPVFADTWNDAPAAHDVDAQAYGAVVNYPLTVNEALHAVLSIAFRGHHPWTEADRALVRGVGRGLNVALERTHTARQLMLQNAELQARTQALAAFADLTRDLALTTDPLLLIRRAQEIVMSMLADGAALYYVPEGDRWHNHSQHGDLHSPALQAAVDAGLPLNETRNLLTPWTTGQPHFQNVYDQTTDQLANVEHIGATATLPLRIGGSVIGVLAFVLFHQRAWSSVDRVLLETAVQSLELALDRAAKTRTLEEERVALQAFMRFTEVVGSDTDVQVLVQQAITLLEETRLVDVTYFERDGDLFKVRSWSTGFPLALLTRLQAGFPTTQPGFARAQQARQAVFEDHWDAVGRGIPEGAQHGVLAIQPFFEGQEMTSVLVMGSRTSVTWSERDRGIFRAVGRSLELALDRAAKTRRLEEERTALEAFTRFTEAVGTQSDVQVLVQQAITLLHETCAVDVAHFQREGELFKVTAWSDSADPALLPLLQHGFLLRDSSIAQVLRQNIAAFIDHWNDTGLLIAESGIYQAVAGYPYFVDGELERVLMIGSLTSATWDDRTRGIFPAVCRSLDVALQRATQTQLLRAQRDALAARTQELSIATEELEVFSYSVSHDLRTPVRHMLGFLQLARKALDGQLDARSARYLDVVGQAGQQMNALIDALLDVSRTARQPLNMTAVDLNRVLQHIQHTLTPDLLTRNIQWHVAALPVVQGDQTALTQVMTQFIENALKFTRTRDPAVIRVYAADQGDTWGVFVQDNGVGFDPRYRERLFNLFQRLHSAQEVTGTGVGLASVRRLILKHGGQVFAEGHVEQGATFGFSLPKGTPRNTRTP